MRRGVCHHGACYCFPGADGADCALDSTALDTSHPPVAAATAASPSSTATVVSRPRPDSPRSWLERARLTEAAAAAETATAETAAAGTAAATSRSAGAPPASATTVAPAPDTASYARDQIAAILRAHSAERGVAMVEPEG